MIVEGGYDAQVYDCRRNSAMSRDTAQVLASTLDKERHWRFSCCDSEADGYKHQMNA